MLVRGRVGVNRRVRIGGRVIEVVCLREYITTELPLLSHKLYNKLHVLPVDIVVGGGLRMLRAGYNYHGNGSHLLMH